MILNIKDTVQPLLHADAKSGLSAANRATPACAFAGCPIVQRGSQVWDSSFKPGIVFYMLPCMIKFACHLVTSCLSSFSSWLRKPSTVELCVSAGLSVWEFVL